MSHEDEAGEALVATIDALIDHYLEVACPCRFPRFRAVVRLNTEKMGAGSFFTRERLLLVLAFEKKVPIVDRRPLPPWTQIENQLWQGECGRCRSTVSRSANESGLVDYLVFKMAKDAADVGAPQADGPILRVTGFTPGGPNAGGAGKAAALYPRVSADEFVRWLSERATDSV